MNEAMRVISNSSQYSFTRHIHPAHNIPNVGCVKHSLIPLLHGSSGCIWVTIRTMVGDELDGTGRQELHVKALKQIGDSQVFSTFFITSQHWRKYKIKEKK